MAYTLFGSIHSPDAANVPSTAMPPVGAGAAASRANGSIGAPAQTPTTTTSHSSVAPPSS